MVNSPWPHSRPVTCVSIGVEARSDLRCHFYSSLLYVAHQRSGLLAVREHSPGLRLIPKQSLRRMSNVQQEERSLEEANVTNVLEEAVFTAFYVDSASKSNLFLLFHTSLGGAGAVSSEQAGRTL